ncbi:MAG: hypothetical protein AB7G28_00585 [Pirellulales bacterium]
MGLDIRYPIGSMFALLGLILIVFGLITNHKPIYAKSLDINVNLWWGLVMLVFGGVMLFLAKRADRSS